MNLLSLINPSLAHGYCSTTLSNHGLIRWKDSSRKVIVNYAISFVISLYLILHACVKHSMEQRLKFRRDNQPPPNSSANLFYVCSWWQEQASGLAAKVRYYFWHSRGPMLPPWRVRNSDHSPGHQSQQCPVGSKAEAQNNWLWACSSPMRWPNSSYDRSCRDSVSNTLTAWLSSVLFAPVMHDLSDRQSQRSHQVR